MTQRHLMWASVVAGVVGAIGFIFVSLDAAYYDPGTPFDYFGSISNDLGLLTAGVALVVWWRVTPVRRSALLILGTGAGLLLWTVGNVLEELMGLDLGETVYFVGAVGAFGLSAAAGVVTLSAPSRWRWSGLVLLAIAASIGYDVLPFAPPAWLVFAYLLARGWFDTPAPQRG